MPAIIAVMVSLMLNINNYFVVEPLVKLLSLLHFSTLCAVRISGQSCTLYGHLKHTVSLSHNNHSRNLLSITQSNVNRLSKFFYSKISKDHYVYL